MNIQVIVCVRSNGTAKVHIHLRVTNRLQTFEVDLMLCYMMWWILMWWGNLIILWCLWLNLPSCVFRRAEGDQELPWVHSTAFSYHSHVQKDGESDVYVQVFLLHYCLFAPWQCILVHVRLFCSTDCVLHLHALWRLSHIQCLLFPGATRNQWVARWSWTPGSGGEYQSDLPN